MWLLILGMTLGVVLLVLGLRGRRVDDHPLCRRCRRDLFGLADVTTCPECGHDPQPVRIGNRERRPRFVGFGVTLLTLAALPLAAVVTVSVADIDLNRHKPVWLLMRESRTSVEAVEELRSRQTQRILTPAQVEQMAETFLRHQADLDLPWLDGKGDCIQDAFFAGNIDEGEWLRFLAQALSPAIVVQETPCAGSDVHFEFNQAAARGPDLGSTFCKIVLIVDGATFATEQLTLASVSLNDSEDWLILSRSDDYRVSGGAPAFEDGEVVEIVLLEAFNVLGFKHGRGAVEFSADDQVKQPLARVRAGPVCSERPTCIHKEEGWYGPPTASPTADGV